MTQLDQVENKITQLQPKLIWLETPGNPMWTVSDIRAIADIAKHQGAHVAVDSTVATPILTRPLELGADIVMHSATKYLNGHSDVIAGALATRENDDFWKRILAIRAQGGAVPSPMDAAQLLRGMRTLFLRVRESCDSAMFLAQQLEQHPMVSEVLYPGLPSFAGYEIACKQMECGFGACYQFDSSEASNKPSAPQPKHVYGTARLRSVVLRASLSIVPVLKERARLYPTTY